MSAIDSSLAQLRPCLNRNCLFLTGFWKIVKYNLTTDRKNAVIHGYSHTFIFYSSKTQVLEHKKYYTKY